MRRRFVLLILLTTTFLFSLFYGSRAVQEQAKTVSGKAVSFPVVLVDAGHGGKDPGKVGINDALEKDINLSIAKKLKTLLEFNDITVIMTREEDKDLASEGAANRKNEDLRNRIQRIRETNPVLVVSIHQNSFPEEDVDGAQVFYYSGSEEGKRLGTVIQESLKTELRDGNHRVAKANREYYMLKQSIGATVMIECGFLSNQREAALLATEEYQEKVAFAIHLGVLEYINTMEEENNEDKNSNH